MGAERAGEPAGRRKERKKKTHSKRLVCTRPDIQSLMGDHQKAPPDAHHGKANHLSFVPGKGVTWLISLPNLVSACYVRLRPSGFYVNTARLPPGGGERAGWGISNVPPTKGKARPMACYFVYALPCMYQHPA